MPIRCLIIFFALAVFIPIDSDGLPAIYTKNEKRAESDSADNVNFTNEKFTLLPKANNSEESTKTRKFSTYLNHQETTDHRRNENEEILAEKNYQHLITSLSKIAKIQLDEESEEDSVITKRCLMANAYNDTQKKSDLQSKISTQNARESVSFDPPCTKTEKSSEVSKGINNTHEIQQENINCHPVQDIYIPEIKEKVPSYSCKFGNKTFILSSKRFFQDRRSSLHINVANDMLRKLNTTTPTNNQFNIIPALLVLKPSHENYDIYNPQNFQDQV